MFVITTKLSKRKAVAIVLAIAVVLGAIIFLAGRRDRGEIGPQTRIEVGGEADIVTFLTGLGWEVDPTPIEIQEILIPREFSDVYERYNRLQIEAGFDLSHFRGHEAMRYTYQVLNYPDKPEGIVADVIVANGAIIGGDIQSIQLDGFMHGLIALQ